MAEEELKEKQKIVLHKREKSVPASESKGEKPGDGSVPQRVVIKAKRADFPKGEGDVQKVVKIAMKRPADGAKGDADAARAVKVPVKRTEPMTKADSGTAPAATVTPPQSGKVPSEQKTSQQTEAGTEPAKQNTGTPTEDASATKPDGKRRHIALDLFQKRPNSRQGNLAAKPSGKSGFARKDGRRDGNQQGGFSGAQARASFQNRGNRQDGFEGGRFGSRRDGPQREGGPRPFGPRPGMNRPFAPASDVPVDDGKKANKRKVFTAKKAAYSRKDKEHQEDFDKFMVQKKKTVVQSNPVPKEIEIMETVSVSDLAKKMNLKASEIISKLMSMGMMVSITQSIDAETATIVADEFDCEVKIVSLYDETVIASDEGKEEDIRPRPPVVTIMGHVDHGKTKTLDAIRSTNVVATEFGGITQHIGAYMVQTQKGAITFLDTPGHEAFTMMRARGAKVTDIVVLVVAADDGVMPQTVEAINHAKDADVPIIVAVNKVDKPEANPDRVKTQLSDLGLVPEEWGGQTQYVHISALKREGLDDLLDAILLQAEVLELRANENCRAEGRVIESRIDHGRGIVATVIIERGRLKLGDPYVGGICSGRVRAIYNDLGQKITEATPSMPVEIIGFEAMPNAGDPFQVTQTEKEARAISVKRQELKRFEDSKSVKKITLDNLFTTISEGEILELKVVIKADVQGSAETLKTSLEKLSTPEIRLNVIHSSAGAINESDVMLAAADSNAIIIGFNVRPTPKAKMLAEQERVDIRKYNVIYKAIEEISMAMEGMLKPDVKEETIGMVEVRRTFKVPKVGIIAGCYVLEGNVKRTASVNVIREGIVIYSGKIASLKREKDDAKEVASGYECGIGVENWQDIKEGDQFEVFEHVEVARKLSDTIKKPEENKE